MKVHHDVDADEALAYAAKILGQGESSIGESDQESAPVMEIPQKRRAPDSDLDKVTYILQHTFINENNNLTGLAKTAVYTTSSMGMLASGYYLSNGSVVGSIIGLSVGIAVAYGHNRLGLLDNHQDKDR